MLEVEASSYQRIRFWQDFDSAWRAFWRVICHWRHIDTYIVLSHRKKTESFPVWSKRLSIESDNQSCCSSRRCEVELELSHSFTPATIKFALLTAFLKRSNRDNFKISLVRVFSKQSSFQTRQRCASRVYSYLWLHSKNVIRRLAVFASKVTNVDTAYYSWKKLISHRSTIFLNESTSITIESVSSLFESKCGKKTVVINCEASREDRLPNFQLTVKWIYITQIVWSNFTFPWDVWFV